MSEKLKITILSVLAVVVAIVLFVGITIEGVVDSRNLFKAAIVLVGLIVAAIKITTLLETTEPLKKYEKAYAEFIGKAFLNDNYYRKCLLEITRCYAEDDLKNGISKANELWNNCETVEEKKAVATFKALILKDLGDEEEAIEVYEYIINDLKVQNDTIYSNLGLLYDKLGNYERAVKNYISACRINPDNAYVWNNAASVFIRIFEIDKAIICAKNAIKKNYKMYNAYQILAAAYTYKGDKKLAEKYYHVAVVNGADREALKAFIKRFMPDENLFEYDEDFFEDDADLFEDYTEE